MWVNSEEVSPAAGGVQVLGAAVREERGLRLRDRKAHRAGLIPFSASLLLSLQVLKGP